MMGEQMRPSEFSRRASTAQIQHEWGASFLSRMGERLGPVSNVSNGSEQAVLFDEGGRMSQGGRMSRFDVLPSRSSVRSRYSTMISDHENSAAEISSLDDRQPEEADDSDRLPVFGLRSVLGVFVLVSAIVAVALVMFYNNNPGHSKKQTTPISTTWRSVADSEEREDVVAALRDDEPVAEESLVEEESSEVAAAAPIQTSMSKKLLVGGVVGGATLMGLGGVAAYHVTTMNTEETVHLQQPEADTAVVQESDKLKPGWKWPTNLPKPAPVQAQPAPIKAQPTSGKVTDAALIAQLASVGGCQNGYKWLYQPDGRFRCAGGKGTGGIHYVTAAQLKQTSGSSLLRRAMESSDHGKKILSSSSRNEILEENALTGISSTSTTVAAQQGDDIEVSFGEHELEESVVSGLDGGEPSADDGRLCEGNGKNCALFGALLCIVFGFALLLVCGAMTMANAGSNNPTEEYVY